jgi:hypothetical protein
MQQNIDFRNSQSYSLGSGFNAPAAAHTLNFQAQRDVLLGGVVIDTIAAGAVAVNAITAFTVQGQSLLCSNQNPSANCLSSLAQDDGANFIGIPLIANGQVQIQTAGAAGATAIAGIYCDPWSVDKQGPVPPPDSLGPSALNYLVGMGQVVIASAGGGAGVVGQLQCTVLRDCQLGLLALNYLGTTDPGHLAVTSIVINQTEQLVSTNAVPARQFLFTNPEMDQRTLGAFAPMNSTVTITFTNNDPAVGNAANIEGHFFALPA